MTPKPVSLPLPGRKLLRALEPLVPTPEREEWTRAWQAEFWHLHHRAAGPCAPNLSLGVFLDALWLRTESCKRALRGTAALCVASLGGLILLSTLIAFALAGSWHPYLAQQFNRSAFAAPLILFVACATASRRHTEQGSTRLAHHRIKRRFFLALKLVHVLLLAFVLSTDLCQPLHETLPTTADLLQLLAFVLLALVGLRWAFHDQQHRCKHCLRSLSSPARVGRPSHNLLEWNGTELVCTQGHGLLSIPEIETSWCQSSHWVTTN